MPDVFEKVRQHWRREDAGVATERANLKEIAEWESRYNVTMPDDLREYVLQLNGTLNGEAFDFGDGLTSFFPLKAMVPEREFDKHFNNPDMFVFADYMISCYWWCAEVTAEKHKHTRIFVSGSRPKLVAESIEEFLELYISGAKRIHI